MAKDKVYAVYKNDQCEAIGTKKELAEALGVDTKTITYYTSNAYKKRSKGKNQREVFLVEGVE